ncbi:uncharacterized protein V1516DRAFT_626971 [Lipomyces oligophaga]|uniref:uncharacterized protein n=1 Tax=Lipomyces oligophaga TaxID=45792 RepID=UPI0034CEEACF
MSFAAAANFYRKELRMLFSEGQRIRIVYRSSPDILLSPHDRVDSLIVFDSSYNPPTVAHLGLVRKPIGLVTTSARSKTVIWVLLMLGAKNADKPSTPAALEERLAMMELFSRSVTASAPSEQVQIKVAIAITPFARFIDKAEAVADAFPGVQEQEYLTGFDTLIRLLDSKYYPGQSLSTALDKFMSQCSIVCYIRDSPSYGTASEQQSYVDDIGNGKNDQIPRAWASKIDLRPYEDNTEIFRKLPSASLACSLDLSLVSSTSARDAAKYGKVSSIYVFHFSSRDGW